MGQSIFQSSPEFAGAIEGARVVVGPHRTKKTRRGWDVRVAEEHRRWGPVVRLAARAVFCMGRIRDEEEEGLGDVGSSSNRLKWSTDPNADMPLYPVPSSYLLSTAPESIKLNNVPLIIPNLLLKYESDMRLILLKQITFNWSANIPTLLSKRTCTTHWSS